MTTGLKYVTPLIAEMFAQRGRVTVDEAVEYLVDNSDPFVIESIQKEALRDIARRGIRQYGKSHSETAVPGVLNVGDGVYARTAFTTLDERLKVIASYHSRVTANAVIRDALADDTLEHFADLPNVAALVRAAKSGLVAIEDAAA